MPIDHCIEGGNSWCTFKIDQANGTDLHVPGKGLQIEVIKHVKDVFNDLSDEKLLVKRLHWMTQNQN